MRTGRRCSRFAVVVAGLAAVLGLVAVPAAQAQQSAIDQRYAAEATLRQLLGPPTSTEVVDGAVHYRTYQYGNLYYTPATGVHEVHGLILAAYIANGHYAKFGTPTTDERAANQQGRHNIFDLAGANGTVTTSGIYWRQDLGAHPIFGPVFSKWAANNWEWGLYGYPTSDNLTTASGALFNHFIGGDGFGASIYYTPQTGANGVKGSIRDRWISLGADYSFLGIPVSDEFSITGGKRSNFQGGYITWVAQTGATSFFHY